MKKLILFFVFIFWLFQCSALADTGNSNKILIQTQSCKIADTNDTRCGNPFHIYNSDTYVFPVITDGNIYWLYSNYIDINGNEYGGVSEAADYKKFEQLKDGNVYQIIADESYNIFAVSADGNKTVLLHESLDFGCDGTDIEKIIPPKPIETNDTIVDILSPYSKIITPDMYTVSEYTGDALMELPDFIEFIKPFNADFEENFEKPYDSEVTVYIPIRNTCEHMGLSISYNSSDKTITVKNTSY